MTTTEERLSRLEGAYEHVATKADLIGEVGSVRTELANLRAELKTDIGDLRAELKSDIGSLRADMHRMNATNLKWLYGLTVTVVVAAGAGVASVIIGLTG